MKKFFSLILGIGALALISCSNNSKAQAAEPASMPDTLAQGLQKKQKVSLAFVGDVMMGTNFPDSSYITRDRGASLFKDCKQALKAADFAVANLEGTCYYGQEGELRKMTNPKTYYIFRMPGDHAKHLVDAGFDAVGIANNHSNDFGTTGRKKTLANLRSVGLGITGLKEMAEVCLMQKDGLKFGFLQFAASCTRTLDLLNQGEVVSYIKDLRPKCDVLIVTFHGGAEGEAQIHVPKKQEFYVGENRGNVYEFAHLAIENGADIVVGHGPHVPRGMELYKGHLIAYSLGNFCAPYRLGIGGNRSMAPLLVAEVEVGSGRLLGGKIHSFCQVAGVGPRADQNNGAAKLIRRVSLEDFPASELKISEQGDLSL